MYKKTGLIFVTLLLFLISSCDRKGTNMGFVEKIKSFLKPNKTVEEMQNDPNLIEVYDEYGRQLFVSKEVWRKDVLPGQLEKDWDDADALYSDIVSALRDEFYKDVLGATARLLEIDTNRERAITIRGITLMKVGKIDQAEDIFQNYMDKNGRSAIILTNLAKVYAERGDDAGSFKILRESLEIDPNMDNAVEWYMAIHNEKGGSAEVKSALRDLAQIDGSWRPQLWLARYALEENDLASALNLYEGILDLTDDSDALMMISGDLGNNGHIEQILGFVAPVYLPEKHGPNAGRNLLEACKQLGNYELGLQLVHKMRMQNWHPFTQMLIDYSNIFEDMKPLDAQDVNLNEEKAGALLLDRPIWMYGLGDAKWLEVHKSESSSKIVFLALNAQTDNSGEGVQTQKEDDIGRLSRAVPLFLAEPLYFGTSLSPQVLIFAFPKKGPILMGGKFDWDYLESLQINDAALFVTGEVSYSEKGYGIALHVWDPTSKKEIASLEQKGTKEELGEKIAGLSASLDQKLSEILEWKRIREPSLYSKPPIDQIPVYIEGLAQSLTLTLVSNDYGSSGELWGERNIYGSALALSVSNPKWVAPKFLFASNMLKGDSFKSKVTAEFKKQLVALLRDSKGGSDEFIKISPILLKKFGASDEYQNSIERFRGKYGADYDEWLLSLEKGNAT